jgi:hypothetical protein
MQTLIYFILSQKGGTGKQSTNSHRDPNNQSNLRQRKDRSSGQERGHQAWVHEILRQTAQAKERCELMSAQGSKKKNFLLPRLWAVVHSFFLLPI